MCLSTVTSRHLLAVMAEFAGCAAIARAVDLPHVFSNIFGPAKTVAALEALKGLCRARDVFVLLVFCEVAGSVKPRGAVRTFETPYDPLPSFQHDGV